MRTNNGTIHVITPVFEDAAAWEKLVPALSKVLGPSLHLVAVDDGSVQHPLTEDPFLHSNVHGVVLTLKRNVGHQQAIAIGLDYISEEMGPDDRVVIMDSDGEDTPETLPQLLDQLAQSDEDVVVAERGTRTETLRFRIFYTIYKTLFRILTGRPIAFGNFMALKPAAVRRLVAMQELSTHVAATVLASKLRIGASRVDRGTRYAGKSKMRFVSLVLHGFKGLMIFAEDVLLRVGITCAAIAGASVLGALTAVFLKTIGFATPGWFSLALGILMLTFIQTSALALITLMLTGMVRGHAFAQLPRYDTFIERVIKRP